LFFDNNIGEDSIFTLKVIQYAKKYEVIEYAGYNNFYENDTNVTNTLHKGLSDKVNILALLEELQSIQGTKEQRDLIEYNIVRTCAYYLLSYGKYATPERFKAVFEQLFSWIELHVKNVTKNPHVRHMPAGERMSAYVGIRLLLFLRKTHLTSAFATIYCRNK
jgi:hypothetical protein